jgi:hypothetical protein
MFSNTVRSSYRENFWLMYPMFFFMFSVWVYTSNPAIVASPELGLESPQSMAHGGGLAGAVRSEETKDLSLPDFERDLRSWR